MRDLLRKIDVLFWEVRGKRAKIPVSAAVYRAAVDLPVRTGTTLKLEEVRPFKGFPQLISR